MIRLRDLLLVGAGGFVGAALRYAVGTLVQRAWSDGSAGAFPLGTLSVNVVGCLAIGILAGLADARDVLGPAGRLVLVVGVLGGFTTFSAFALDTLGLARAGDVLRAAANVGASVVLCLAGVWAGYALGRR